jgi:subtilisin family serine protease
MRQVLYNVLLVCILGGVAAVLDLSDVTTAYQPTPARDLIIGVTDVDAALRELDPMTVRHVMRPIRAIAITGDVTALDRRLIRYMEPDPPDAVRVTDDLLDYGVDNIQGEVVWGGAENATDVIPGQGGAGIKLGIIDTGIDCTHEDLAPDCTPGANFVNPPFVGDDHGHGTHVAGLAAARDNGLGTIGTAPEASLYGIKVLDNFGSGSWSGVAMGILWAADNGMHVINMSLGGSGFSQAVADSVDYAQSKGVLIVSAAGNSGGCATCDTVLYPAKYPHSMAIAAVDSSDTRASFSSTGPEVDVAAPGVSNLAPVPTGACSLCDPSGYRRLSGTSMATPHTAGVGVLLMSRGLTNVAARQRIQDTAVDLPPAGKEWLTGCGRVDAVRAVGNIGAPCGSPPPPPPPPPAECSANFAGSVHHREPVPEHIFAAGTCTGNFVIQLTWSNSRKDMRLSVVTPAGVEHVADCCYPESLTLPVEVGDWRLRAGTKSNGRLDYSVTVSNP